MTDDEKAEARVYERALSLLSYRARSAKDLAKKLVEKGEDPVLSERAIARLVANGLLDDGRLAESVAHAGMVGRARSSRRVQQDLARKGVAPDVAREAIARVLDDAGTDEDALALAAARKKLRSLEREDPAARRRKLLAFLARQGFSMAACFKAAKSALDAPPADGEA